MSKGGCPLLRHFYVCKENIGDVWFVLFNFYVYARPPIHFLYFIYVRTHVKITRQWKSTLSKPAKPAGSSARAKFWQRAVKPFGEWGAYALTLFRAMAASLAKVSHAQNNSASYAWETRKVILLWKVVISIVTESVFAKELRTLNFKFDRGNRRGCLTAETIP